MVSAPERPGYRSVSGEEIVERAAGAALQLVLRLLQQQDANTGAWNAHDVRASLQRTCQALEALHLLRWHTLRGPIEAGLAWLVNITDSLNSDDDGDRDEVVLHPSRFKTLAWLDGFDDPRIRREFARLGNHMDQEGIIQHIERRPTLATLIYADCVHYLVNLAKADEEWQRKQAQALSGIVRTVRAWAEPAAAGSFAAPSLTVSDASYALDVLVRCNYLSADGAVAAAIKWAMIAVLGSVQHNTRISKEMLYCAIQLATHFAAHEDAEQAVHAFLLVLIARCEEGSLNQEDGTLYALLLRTLLAYRSSEVEARMVGIMLRNEQERLDTGAHLAEKRRNQAFEDVIRQMLHIDIRKAEPLTGGITEAEVFRVHFDLRLSTLNQNGRGQPVQIAPIVIKSGAQEKLLASIERYRKLPAVVKPLFARHSDTLRVLDNNSSAMGYLVLEDLTEEYKTLRACIDDSDRWRRTAKQKSELIEAVDTAAQTLFEMYEATAQPTSDAFHLARLYMGRIEHFLLVASQREHFPLLKTWYDRCEHDGVRYPSISHYLTLIGKQRAQFRLAWTMLIHGDCHTRNIMLDNVERRGKLIDLDKLDYEGDYVLDFAQLIEDVALFRSLFDPSYSFRLKPEDVELSNNRAEYRLAVSEAGQDFQHHVMELLEQYATQRNDDTWRQRLWLGAALHVLSLIRLQKEQRFAAVLYLEALKLLQALGENLEKGIPLPAIPFPGDGPDGPPSRKPAAATLLHAKLAALEGVESRPPSAEHGTVRYYIAGLHWPVAVLDIERQHPRLLLACAVERLNDPRGRLTPLDEARTHRSAAGLVPDAEGAAPDDDLDYIAGLVRQCVGNVRGSGASSP